MDVITAVETETFPIGVLSRLTGVHIETIRYYERINMLPAPPRAAAGHRPMHVQTLSFIRRCRELGFTMDDIRALLALGGPADRARKLRPADAENITRRAADHSAR